MNKLDEEPDTKEEEPRMQDGDFKEGDLDLVRFNCSFGSERA